MSTCDSKVSPCQWGSNQPLQGEKNSAVVDISNSIDNQHDFAVIIHQSPEKPANDFSFQEKPKSAAIPQQQAPPSKKLQSKDVESDSYGDEEDEGGQSEQDKKSGYKTKSKSRGEGGEESVHCEVDEKEIQDCLQTPPKTNPPQAAQPSHSSQPDNDYHQYQSTRDEKVASSIQIQQQNSQAANDRLSQGACRQQIAPQVSSLPMSASGFNQQGNNNGQFLQSNMRGGAQNQQSQYQNNNNYQRYNSNMQAGGGPQSKNAPFNNRQQGPPNQGRVPMISDYHLFNNQLVRALIDKNFELGQSHTDMAKGVVEFCRNLTSLIGPVLENKEKENKRLKRIISERLGDHSDDEHIS